MKKVPEALLTVTDRVYHFDASGAEAPYFVWGEEGGDDAVYADNARVQSTISGTIDYFTPYSEDYQTLDKIEMALIDAGIPFSLLFCEYEDDTKLCHYGWGFTVG